MSITTDIEAKATGFTRLVYADCSMYDGVYLVKPDADLDGVVRAWDTGTYRFVKLNGWLWSFEDAEG